MKLTAAELAYVRSKGPYITKKCDGCGKAPNQIHRYKGPKAEVHCSAPCRDFAFFGDRHEAKKKGTTGASAHCGGV
jgi:hypothetical protein